MNSYLEFKKKQEKEYNIFSNKYLAFAFDQEQLKQAMTKLKVKNKAELIGLGGGCIIKKIDLEKYKTFRNKQFKELLKKQDDDKFLFDGFKYEMGNYEYIFNQDDEKVLNALGLTADAIHNNKRLNKIYNNAKEQYFKDVDF